MEEQPGKIESLIEKAEQYGKTTLELVKLKSLDKTADVASNLVSWIAIAIVAVLFFFFLNIGVALWLGDLMGSNYYGFFAVSGFYVVLLVVFLVFRKTLIKKPVNNSIVKQVLK
jgi:hypothetical protein